MVLGCNGSEATGSLQVLVDIIYMPLVIQWQMHGQGLQVRDPNRIHNRVHVSICSLQNVPFPLLPQTFTEPFLFDTKPVLSYEIPGLTTLHAPALCSFKFTHPPVLSALLLILPASRFLVADFPLLVPVPFSVFGPSSLKDLSLPLRCRLSFTLEIYICNTMSSEFLMSL